MLPNYKLFEHKNVKDLTCVLIENGEFEGIAYHYGVVSVTPSENEDDQIPISYSYDIIEGSVNDEQKQEFQNVISEILFDIVAGKEE